MTRNNTDTTAQNIAVEHYAGGLCFVCEREENTEYDYGPPDQEQDLDAGHDSERPNWLSGRPQAHRAHIRRRKSPLRSYSARHFIARVRSNR